MWQQTDLSDLTEVEAWKQRVRELDALISIDEPAITALANAAAFIWTQLDKINWAGFYLFNGEQKDGKLVLGPFLGKPACTVIAMGKGVCGTAAEKRETIVVDDVHQFPGHIACDGDSASEIVVPLIANGQLLGVLDIDSPVLTRFDQATTKGIEQLAALISSKLAAIQTNESRFRI